MAPFGSQDEKEICWQLTKFKGKYKVDPVKPVVKMSISWEMYCACASEDWRGDSFNMEPDPPCSEFTGKFQERTFSCDEKNPNERFGIGPDCCTETKCALVTKDISFDELMPLPFELATPADDDAEGRCAEGWETDIPDWQPGVFEQPPHEPGLTPRAQALREFGCSEAGQNIFPIVRDAVLNNPAGPPGTGTVVDEDGKWNYADVVSEQQRDHILRMGLICNEDERPFGFGTGDDYPSQEEAAESIMKLCFILGGAYDTDNDDQVPGSDNGGVTDESDNSGLDEDGWVNKTKPKFNCRTCECEDIPPPAGTIGGPPIKCTDPPCEEPKDL